MNQTQWQFWIDRGGTFTDIVAQRPDGSLLNHKLLSENPQHYQDAAIQGIRDIFGLAPDEPLPIDQIATIKMGTTVATNALLERKGERTVLVITQGFKDALRIGYQNRPDLFALQIILPELLYEQVIEVDERYTAQGEELKPVPLAAVRRELQAVRHQGIATVAIVFMHGYRYPHHEQQVAALARELGFTQISVSHEISPLIKLISRGDTTVVDAYLSPILRRYIDSVARELGQVKLLFMQSNGGLTDAKWFQGKDAILSGPAGGYVGAVKTSALAGFTKIINFDMGGTSTDVSHYAGEYERDFETLVAGVRMRTPIMRIHTVAAGGGSIIHFDGLRLRVGPDSAGAKPGPACYRQGGPLTITDCNVLLGKLSGRFFPQVFGESGREPLDETIVKTQLTTLTAEINQATGQQLTPNQVAEGFLKIAVENMANAIKKISVQRGYDVTEYTLCCFGAAAGQHACLVADALGIKTILIHPQAGVLSALGMGLADIRTLHEQTIAAELAEPLMEQLTTVLTHLEQCGRDELLQQGVAATAIQVRYQVQLRYTGTDTPLLIDFATVAEMTAHFAHLHQQQFGFVRHDSALIVEAAAVEVIGTVVKPLPLLPPILTFPHQEEMEPNSYPNDNPINPQFFPLQKMAKEKKEILPPWWGKFTTLEPSPSLSQDAEKGQNDQPNDYPLDDTAPFPIPWWKKFATLEPAHSPLHNQEKGTNDKPDSQPLDTALFSFPWWGKFATSELALSHDVAKKSTDYPNGNPIDTVTITTGDQTYLTPVYSRQLLPISYQLIGPAIIIEKTSTTVVEPGWQAEITARYDIVLTRYQPIHSQLISTMSTAIDPIRLEIFNNLFMSIAEQMGVTLANTAYSVNIKERLDFSCALFDKTGQLIANAPHIPIHLGSMSDSVQTVIHAQGNTMQPGDVFVLNNPYHGGTHLPDITVITPVFLPTSSDSTQANSVLFYVASRGHHADIGGITPGSMPPQSRTLLEEGVIIDIFKLVDKGQLREAEIRQLLTNHPYPARNIEQNLADLRAQIAANAKGVQELHRMVQHFGLEVVQAYMQHVQDHAEKAVRQLLTRLNNGEFRYELDDGAAIQVKITVDKPQQRAIIDFSGTSPQQATNFNAPIAVCKAAVLYVFRTLVNEDIPLNAGCLKPLQLIIPPGCLLNPTYPAAVVAGNVETSQYITDALYGALGVMAASQGTMNNLTFGNEKYQYYETICGGSGAGPHFQGTTAVQTHMTNSRLTDPEVLEWRFPVLLKSFAIRNHSGGAGRYYGGDGVIRRIQFREAMTASILSSHRRIPPHGMAGGQPGQIGHNWVERSDGTQEILTGTATVAMQAGDVLVIETPGGGGYGVAKPE
ncbi:hydantoinase/oxoprolinase [Thioploca ingrica]|uniref:Hydantoinase/oxoprolinase n=1 Tax=Thioploca ingrica TaxID=40754 RepID=A0A090AM30_9GAMM|nr:hydantoinase/oxoprolinase [Thioploca ingrica]